MHTKPISYLLNIYFGILSNISLKAFIGDNKKKLSKVNDDLENYFTVRQRRVTFLIIMYENGFMQNKKKYQKEKSR